MKRLYLIDLCGTPGHMGGDLEDVGEIQGLFKQEGPRIELIDWWSTHDQELRKAYIEVAFAHLGWTMEDAEGPFRELLEEQLYSEAK